MESRTTKKGVSWIFCRPSTFHDRVVSPRGLDGGPKERRGSPRYLLMRTFNSETASWVIMFISAPVSIFGRRLEHGPLAVWSTISRWNSELKFTGLARLEFYFDGISSLFLWGIDEELVLMVFGRPTWIFFYFDHFKAVNFLNLPFIHPFSELGKTEENDLVISLLSIILLGIAALGDALNIFESLDHSTGTESVWIWKEQEWKE